MMNQSMKDILERRSIKNYKKEQIRDEELSQILEAGLYAACGMGKQSPVLVAVQDEKTRAQLLRMNAEIEGHPKKDTFYGAPTVVVVLGDTNCATYVEDGSLAIGNMMNAAHAIGVGSCWIHRARQEFESEEGKALLKEWGLGENYAGVGHCILGYQEGDAPKAEPRREGRVVRV